MEDDRIVPPEDIRAETDSFTGGPGVAATKSQAVGGLLGTMAGLVVGAMIGLIVALVAGFHAFGLVVSVVVFGFAGLTFGGVVGGFIGPRRRLPKSEADT
jgi:uncharacterized membrane protein